MRWIGVGVGFAVSCLGCTEFVGVTAEASTSDTAPTQSLDEETSSTSGATGPVPGTSDSTGSPDPTHGSTTDDAPDEASSTGREGDDDGHEDTDGVAESSSTGEEPADVCPPPEGLHVLLLDDGNASTAAAVVTTLTEAGATVFEAGPYQLWDGITGTDVDVDLVIYLNASQYSSDLTAQAQTSLNTFLEGGGVLVRTEWSLWSGPNLSLYSRLPVEQTPNNGYGGATQWTTALPDHALAHNLPETPWTSSGSCTHAVPKPEAEVIVEDPNCGPAVSLIENGGKVVHINSTLNNLLGTPQLQQVLINALYLSSPCSPP